MYGIEVYKSDVISPIVTNSSHLTRKDTMTIYYFLSAHWNSYWYMQTDAVVKMTILCV